MKNQFDHQYSNAFEHLETPPPPMVWQAVEARLDNKKRRRGVVFWWTSSALLAASISVFVLLPNSVRDSSRVVSSNHAIENQEQVINSKNDNLVVKNDVVWDNNQQVIANKKRINSKQQLIINNQQPITNIIAFVEKENKDKISDNSLIKRNLVSLELVNVLSPKPVTLIQEEKIAFSDCYEFTKKKRKSKSFYIDGYFGFDLVNKTLANQGRETTKLLDYRQTSESIANAFSGGIRVGAVRGRVGVSAGLQVNHIVERFENIDEYSERTNININKITDANGNVIRLDTVITRVRGKAKSNIYNRYTTFSIPLQLSYHTGVNAWKLAIYAGPVFNLQLKKSGTIFNDSKIPTAFDDNSTIFKSRLGVSFMTSANLSRRLTEHFYCFAEPTFLYQPTSITNTSYVLSQTYKSRVGLYLGVRYKL